MHAVQSIVVPVMLEPAPTRSLELHGSVEVEGGWLSISAATMSALRLADRWLAAKGVLHIVHATSDISTTRVVYGSSEILNPRNVEALHAAAIQTASLALTQILQRVLPKRTPTLKVGPGRPTDRVLSVVDEVEADLVVAAASGRSTLKRMITGSTIDELIRTCPCPVAVVPG